MRVCGRRIELIASTKIYGEGSIDLPVVLNKSVNRPGSQRLCIVVKPQNAERRKADQQIRQRITGQGSLKDNLSAGKKMIKPVSQEAPVLSSEFMMRLTFLERQRVGNVKSSGSPNDWNVGVVAQ